MRLSSRFLPLTDTPPTPTPGWLQRGCYQGVTRLSVKGLLRLERGAGMGRVEGVWGGGVLDFPQDQTRGCILREQRPSTISSGADL